MSSSHGVVPARRTAAFHLNALLGCGYDSYESFAAKQRTTEAVECFDLILKEKKRKQTTPRLDLHFMVP